MKCKAQRLIGVTSVLLLIASTPVGVQAQSPESAYEHQHSRLDLEFPGGTVDDYVNRIREARPSHAANVVVMPNARPLKVPPVTLVAVTVEAAVQLLEGRYVLPDGRRVEIDVTSYAIGDSSDLVMKVTAEIEPLEIRASVWSVEEALMSGQTAEELLGAIEAVLLLFPEKAKVSFHPPTRLLIARGTGEQLSLVRDAIEELIDSAEKRREKIESLREDIEPLDRDLHGMTGEIKIAEQALALAKTRLDRTVRRQEPGIVDSEAVAEAELEMTRMETELENYKLEHARIQTKLESLRDALKKLEKPRE